MKVLVIGDNCTDIFITGRVDRLCPEAPVPVLNPTSKSLNPGMAGNVYENMRSLNPEADVCFVCQDTSITKTRYVDATSGYILLRVDENDKISEQLTLEGLIERLTARNRRVEEFDILLISDYNKGFLTEKNLHDIIDYFVGETNARVFLDTKKPLGYWSRNVDIVKINQKEYQDQLKFHAHPELFCENLVVTGGANGSRIIGDNEICVPSKRVEVMDVSGAGDTYMAALASAYYKSENLEQSMEYANRAAGVAVSKHGVVAVKKSEVEI